MGGWVIQTPHRYLAVYTWSGIKGLNINWHIQTPMTVEGQLQQMSHIHIIFKKVVCEKSNNVFGELGARDKEKSAFHKYCICEC